MTSLQTPTVRVGDSDPDQIRSSVLAQGDADTYAQWFACLAEPMRVRLLHRVASAVGGITVGALAEALGIGQPTVSHHLRKLADVGFVTMRKEGTSTVVAMSPTCCVALPQAADVVMGVLAPRPCCPSDLPDDVSVRAMIDDDWDAVRRIYGEGIDTRNATFAAEVPSREHLHERWLPQHRWVATVEGVVVGWAALSPVSERDCYRGVAENSVYVADGMRGRGVGKALLRKQVMAADADGLWTLQTSMFPENRASISLHHSAGFRTVGLREKIAELDGVWRDTVLLERRTAIAEG
ncbi:metalloregulator ArsR/SmtB family transcription factor [Rhodococcus sp. GOMB7]|uniref:helix-turn-helix domain-containing GNAT family N-acetyltransferase n=1 Tax=Rhodococcus sp. GOMB7 TaxID=2839033 RepID=UPI001BFFF413|nr:metalloregulator ArsR/SmtB family transcription factor [Rhodococcus sp. GOMB7]MBT9296693.1 metalloregulator ArsR/SmtB family transcription factor [Rhodococcus sp. GOMB7]